MAKSSLDDTFTYEADEVMEVIAALPQKERKITLYRLNPQGNSAYIDEFFPEEFSQAVIKERYGGGKYMVHAETLDGMKKMRFSIEGESKIAGAQRTIRKVVNGKAYLVSVSEKEIIDKAITGQPLFDDSLLMGTEYGGRMIPNSEGAASTNQLLMLQLQRLEAKLESLQNANHGGSRREFYEEMALLKGLFASDRPQSDQAQLAEMFKKGLEIAGQAFNGEMPAGNPWLSIVEKSIPILSQAFTQVMNAQRNITPIQQQQANENASLLNGGISDMLPNSTAKLMPANNSPKIIESIKPFLPQLMRSAATDQDPVPWAEIITGQIPESEKQTVVDWLSKEDYFKDLTAIEPAISLQVSWWHDLQNALLDILTGRGEEEHDEEIKQ
jgi:hypothetical protein